METITQRDLKRLLRYDKQTGLFIWRKSLSNHIKNGDIAGTTSSKGYVYIRINGKSHLAHRLAFLYILGYLPENQIDHTNRIRFDNRWSNLKEVSNTCNMRNCGLGKNNKSGIKGVCWNKTEKKWYANIKINKKQIHLGSFKTISDAANKRYEAEIEFDFLSCDSYSTAKQYLDSL